jgi:FkbM family methyltransferase
MFATVRAPRGDTRALRRARAYGAEVLRLLDVMTVVEPGYARMRLLAVWAILSVNHRLKVRPGVRFALRWQGPRSVQRGSVSDVSEIRVIREVFVSGEYELPETTPAVILDLGSNVGITVLYFRDRYPDAKIIAVEPSPVAFERLRHNVGHLKDVRMVQAAATGEDTERTLWTGAESWAGSVHRAPEHAEEHKVAGRTIEGILAEAGESHANLVKMDIEGSEQEVLRSSSAIREADWIVFEFHQEHSSEDVWSLLAALPEFEVVRILGNSREHPLVTLRRKH